MVKLMAPLAQLSTHAALGTFHHHGHTATTHVAPRHDLRSPIPGPHEGAARLLRVAVTRCDLTNGNDQGWNMIPWPMAESFSCVLLSQMYWVRCVHSPTIYWIWLSRFHVAPDTTNTNGDDRFFSSVIKQAPKPLLHILTDIADSGLNQFSVVWSVQTWFAGQAPGVWIGHVTHVISPNFNWLLLAVLLWSLVGWWANFHEHIWDGIKPRGTLWWVCCSLCGLFVEGVVDSAGRIPGDLAYIHLSLVKYFVVNH